MKYVALLRAINVGGRNLIRMADVRACLEARKYERVSTYIQSGNVLFDTDEADVAKLTAAIEMAFLEAFGTQQRQAHTVIRFGFLWHLPNRPLIASDCPGPIRDQHPRSSTRSCPLTFQGTAADFVR